jgi:hypothetical protein
VPPFFVFRPAQDRFPLLILRLLQPFCGRLSDLSRLFCVPFEYAPRRSGLDPDQHTIRRGGAALPLQVFWRVSPVVTPVGCP